MKLLAYTRVSTAEQSGRSLDAQEHQLIAHATQRDWWITRIAREQGSGKDLEDPSSQNLGCCCPPICRMSAALWNRTTS